MSEPLNILVVEDSTADFLLVERHLKQKGLSARCIRVDSLKELEEATNRERWDLVLSDYSVPQLDFQEILNLLQKALPDLPVIMVTGTVGEEKAVELLKLGVCDFVLKGNLSRLVPAIERSLKEASERKARVVAERALRSSEVHFRSIFNKSPVAIGIGKAPSGLVMDVNNTLLLLYGYEREEMIGKTTTELNLYVNPDERTEILRLIHECGQVASREVRIRRKTGEHLIVLYSAELIELEGESCIQVMLADVTERRNMEELLRQSQKMEAIGTLAGGVAHDFNNILSAIFGYSHLILNKVKDNGPVIHYVEEIMDASKRAAVLTSSLLAFSRKQAVTLAVIDLNAAIKGNGSFLRRLISEDIELKITCTEEPLTVLVDRSQIEQVVMNLVANARDAMLNGGKLSIETQSVAMSQEFVIIHGYGTPGSYAMVSVSDSGFGMDKETQSHIFEPFFTTKEQGQGTGLGLSMAYGIIKKHNGFINVYSEPGTGTIFKIYLPLTQTSALAEIKDGRKVTPVRVGTETILVGEDDDALRRLSKNVLGHYGYQVIEAVDGQDAVDKFVEHGKSIDLVILDAIMPKKNGKLACDEMRIIRPDLPVVFVSGYTSDIFAEDNVFDDNSAFIQKPVPPVVLLARIRELLDKRTASGGGS
ncbi:MAG: response regulator [Desulfuromonadaceae bacterium]|nr:response regulator [Desulfuromonadaceae bacterium]MDD2847262.1 response regulator [Desulfuromonadaceae bacterium]MDD4130206.1 response regulator [Desulfuromonadaceae bacterium]